MIGANPVVVAVLGLGAGGEREQQAIADGVRSRVAALGGEWRLAILRADEDFTALLPMAQVARAEPFRPGPMAPVVVPDFDLRLGSRLMGLLVQLEADGIDVSDFIVVCFWLGVAPPDPGSGATSYAATGVPTTVAHVLLDPSVRERDPASLATRTTTDRVTMVVTNPMGVNRALGAFQDLVADHRLPPVRQRPAGDAQGPRAAARVRLSRHRWFMPAVALLLLIVVLVTGVLAVALSRRVDVAAPSSIPGEYALRLVGGGPVRWDPCAGSIGVQVDYGDLAPRQRELAQQAVEQGVADASAATGLEFAYRGETAMPPARGSSDRRAAPDAIRIGFLPAGTALLADGTGGKAGAVTGWTTSAVGEGGQWRQVTSADIQIRPRAGGFAALVRWGLARVSGLGNVAPPATPGIMARTDGQVGYGDGDLAGLAAVGADQGCIR